jgi:hypothetical protein
VSESAVSAKRGWGSFGAKPAQSETPVGGAAKRRPPGGGRSGGKEGAAPPFENDGSCLELDCQHTGGTHVNS